MHYTGNGSALINTYLRTGRMTTGLNTLDKVVHLQSAISKLPDFIGTVYRGTVMKWADPSTLVKGEKFRDPAFLSTSKDKSVHKFTASANVTFEITSLTGKDISHLAKKLYKDEAEILFMPNTEFVIDEVEKNEYGQLEVKMTEKKHAINEQFRHCHAFCRVGPRAESLWKGLGRLILKSEF